MNGAVKWLGAGLMGSLLLNFFLVFILVRVISHTGGDGPGRHFGMHGPNFTVGRLTESLAPESKDIVRDIIKSRRSAMRENFTAMSDARSTLEQVLTEEELDTGALETAFADIRAVHLRIQKTAHKAVIEAASQLPHAERVKLAQMGEKLFSRMNRHNPMGHNGPGGFQP